MSHPAPAQLQQLSEFIAASIGLHFPAERLTDLQRGVSTAAREFGFTDATECMDWLLSTEPTKAQLQVLAAHLTIGETYFFRDRKLFDALADSILPELIRQRRGRDQRLRIWSAACCTGEEPYSLAILLLRLVPDLRDWHVTILATDINERFLQKAAVALYREWSFRGTPDWVIDHYFDRIADGSYAVHPRVKELVTFAPLNLVEDVYPSLATGTNAIDMIFCRNALMYFLQPQVSKVILRFHQALAPGGWLVVAPSEASHTLYPQFTTVNLPDVILYRKDDTTLPDRRPAIASSLSAQANHAPPPTVVAPPIPTAPPAPVQQPSASRETLPPVPRESAASLYQQGRFAEVEDALIAASASQTLEPPAVALLARALAHQGKLALALSWCDRWTAADKLDPAAHYLRAVVLLEQGQPLLARASLQRAVYIHPELVVAHFALGNLARGQGRVEETRKHFANALHLLKGYGGDDLLPEADGLTAGRLLVTIQSIID